MKELHALAKAQQAATRSLAAQLRGAIRNVMPRDMTFDLTATQRGGKLRLDIRSIDHEEGWKDSSGGPS